jgi:hypothetical protein
VEVLMTDPKNTSKPTLPQGDTGAGVNHDRVLTRLEQARAAMASRREAYAGSAVGTGSVGFDDPGVFTSADRPAHEDELLIDGQEEVFSRSEVEAGRIEHHSGADLGAGPGAGKTTPVEKG